jgi:hypothetical protein
VLLIVTFRPKFHPAWTGQPQVTTLALNRLDWRERTELVHQIAGGKALPRAVVATVLHGYYRGISKDYKASPRSVPPRDRVF